MTGSLTVVGIGPGHPLDRTRRAEEAIARAEVVAGYDLYLEHIADLLEGKEQIRSGMTAEVERCRAALAAAASGRRVALVSSGDAGIYGMAGLALEMTTREGFQIPIEIVPGVSAASAAAAAFGAPLMLDWACLSLSDLLVDWSIIRARLEAVTAADLVVAIYNPRSRSRVRQLEEAVEILLKHRPATTPVGIGTALGAPDQRLVLSTLERLCGEEVGMRSLVIIGNSTSRVEAGWLLTPRGYAL
ncbi:MAG TPA: precorrin-3B C(17)-methyltransferase [Holophaga sp.]|nr:precorrin-3B C(17)-methyltransferase [Holophaga sp.]